MTAPTAATGGRPTEHAGVNCWQCGNQADADFDHRPVCRSCGVRLVPCDLTGQWVSVAERTRRHLSFAFEVRIAMTGHLAEAGAEIGQGFIPHDWTLQAHQSSPQALFVIALRPPATVDMPPVFAELHPRIPDGWGVDVVDQRSEVRCALGFGSEETAVAPFPGLHEALLAAVPAIAQTLA